MSHACVHKNVFIEKKNKKQCMSHSLQSIFNFSLGKKKKRSCPSRFHAAKLLIPKTDLNLIQEFEGIGHSRGIIAFGSKFQFFLFFFFGE